MVMPRPTPPELRLRGFTSWQYGGLTTNLFVNYTDSYVDNRTITPTPISSYTTVDARVAYSFASKGFLSGVTLAANVQNALNEDPPETVVLTPVGAPTFDLGFDPTNANPLGRFFAIEFTKTW